MERISIIAERESFDAFLRRKALSEVSIKQYLTYLEKLIEIMNETENSLCQAVVDAFLDVYPHAVSRAFLKNYFEMKDRRDLVIVKRTGRMPHKEVIPIPESELKLIHAKLYQHDDRFGLIFDLSVGCALRRQEVMNIRAGDVKVADDVMTILIKKGKGNKERQVVVPHEVALLVIRYCFQRALKPSDALFQSKINEGKVLDQTSWNKAFALASFEVTGKKYHPHQLRHTRATDWFNKGIDIVRIQQRLGHSNIATTRLYLNPDNKIELEKWAKE